MKKVILVLAVAAVFAFSGTVMASPPVCPPFEGFLIETNTNVTVVGNMSEEETFDWTWNNDYCEEESNGLGNPTSNGLQEGESVGRIAYEEDFDSFNGLAAEETTFVKDFSANTHPDGNYNLEVTKDIGYTSDGTAGHHANFTEIASEEIVSAGGMTAAVSSLAGILKLCPWTTSSTATWPATNEGIAMGSAFSIPATLSNGDAGEIDFHSETEVGVSKGVLMNYKVDPATGNGLIQAEMVARLWEGSTAGTTNATPLNSVATYTEKTVADGIFTFRKSMSYKAKFDLPEFTPIGLEILQ